MCRWRRNRQPGSDAPPLLYTTVVAFPLLLSGKECGERMETLAELQPSTTITLKG
jgi:hypothetical protein